MEVSSQRTPYSLFFLAVIFALFCGNREAHARSTGPQFGFGVTNISSGNPAQISLNWKGSEASSLTAYTGLRNGSSNDFFEVGARFNRNLFIEENQDFYFFMGMGIATRSSESGYKLEAGAGSEIFLSGLPNFGLHFNGGFQFSTVNSSALETLVSFGMHYYF